MADRTVSVRLRAVITDYQRAMRTASSETSGFARLANKEFKSLGTSMTDLGKDITRRVSVPTLALGVGAVKVANDFEQAFSQMVGLAGVPAGEVDQLREAVLGLARDTGRGPQELAEGLYFAASAGYDSATALNIVEQAAKGSAAGLGTTAQVVDAVTSAMGAYGTANITAAEATDILTAAARVAKIEANQLAPQLGRLLPTANMLGVGFDEVAGAMAFLSQSSGNAELSATQLDSVLRKLNVPSEQGKKVLREMGTSVDELHAAIASDGLLGALELLKTKGFEGNSEALSQLFDDVQAYQGAALLLADSNGNLQETMDATANSTGALGEAFDAWFGTDSAEMQRSFADLTASLITLGTALAPFAADLAHIASVAGDFFTRMPEWAQTATVLALVLAGPLTSGIGTLIKVLPLLSRAASATFDRIALGAYDLAGSGAAMLTFGTLVTAGVTALYAWNKGKEDARNRTMEFTAALEADNGVLDTNTESLIRNKVAQGDLNDNITQAGYTYDQFVAALESGDEASQAVIKGIFERGKLTGDEVLALGGLVDAYQSATREVAQNAEAGIENKSAAEQQADALAKLETMFNGTAGAAGGAAGQIDVLTEALNASYASIFGLDNVTLDVDKSTAQFNETMGSLNDTTESVGRSTDAAADRLKAIERTTRDAERAQRSYEDSLKQQLNAIADVADAEEALEEARKGPSGKDRAEADRRKRGDAIALQRAQQGVKKAQEDLTKAQEKDDPAEIKDKQLALKEAMLRREEATASLQDSTEHLSDLQSWNAETADEVTDAQDKLTEAKDRAEEATRNVADRQREMNERQEEARDTAAKSVADFDNSSGAVGRHRDKVLEARDAYAQWTEQIAGVIAKLIALDATSATKFQELAAIEDIVRANKFLTEEQRNDLLDLIRANRGAFFAGGKGGFSAGGGVLGMANGGIFPSRPGGHRVTLNPAEAGAAEAFVPLTPAGLRTFMPAIAGYGGGSSSSQPVTVQFIMDDRVVAQAVVREGDRTGGLPIKVRVPY